MMCDILWLTLLLKEWRRNPDAPPSEYSSFPMYKDRHHRFTSSEIKAMREELKRLSPMAYNTVFPEERPGVR
jgi:hypothetical protein